MYIECSQFIFQIEIDKLNKSFWLSSVDQETAQTNSETFIHLKMSDWYSFSCFKLIDESEVAKTYKIKFPDHSQLPEYELIIPMKYLHSVNDGSYNIQNLMSHNDKLEFMKELSKAQKVSFSISYCDEIQYFTEFASLFPQKCLYSIDEYPEPDNWDELETYIKKKLDADCFDDFSNIKFNCIYVCYEISENGYEFIRRLLLLPNVQSYLTCILLMLPKLSQALSILSQLSNWLFIESVDLSYRENDSEIDPLELIKISINSFTKKVGIIEELNFQIGNQSVLTSL